MNRSSSSGFEDGLDDATRVHLISDAEWVPSGITRDHGEPGRTSPTTARNRPDWQGLLRGTNRLLLSRLRPRHSSGRVDRLLRLDNVARRADRRAGTGST